MTPDNPFRPPAADLHAAPTYAAGALMPEGRVLPAAQGWRWARDGALMVAQAPGRWFLVTVVFFVLAVTISVLPIVSLLWNIGMPIVLGGLMLGCHAMAQGRPLELRHMFAGFEAPRLQPLAMIGVLYLAATILLILTMLLVGVGGALGVGAVVGPERMDAQPLLAIGAILVLVLVVLAAALALSMTLWFSPALVAIAGVPPLDAMRMSLRASGRNVLPFLVYGLVVGGLLLLVAAAGGGLLLGTSLAMQSNLIGVPEAMIGAVVTSMLAGVMLAPAVWCAMYASYRDIFIA